MKKVLVGLMLVLFPIILWSQELVVGLQYGLEGNGMQVLKNINSSIIPTIPFETKLVSDFPAYWYYQPSLKLAFKKFGIGINYAYNSTGSRVSGKDYSGEYRFDFRLNKKSPGVFIEYYMLTVKDFRLGFEADAGLMFTSLHLEQNLTVNSTILINDSFYYKSKAKYFQPGLKGIYRWHSFEFEINAAYLFQIGDGAFYNVADIKSRPRSSSSFAAKPEWKGFKVGVGINFILIKPKSEKE